MSTDIKLRKAQLSKIVPSGGNLVKTSNNVMSDLGKKAILDLTGFWLKMFYLN